MTSLFRRLITGSVFLLPLFFLAAIGVNIWTYTRMTDESLVATVHLEKTGDQSYILKLSAVGSEPSLYELAGDEWQLDVRMIKWKSWFSLLGNDPVYRLERINGRFYDIEKENSVPKTAYSLNNNPGLDLWLIAKKNSGWIPVVQDVYGSAVFLPMKDGAQFRVFMSRTGLTAQATNNAAESAVKTWSW